MKRKHLMTAARGATAALTLGFLMAVLAGAMVPELSGFTAGRTGLFLTVAGLSLIAHVVLVHSGVRTTEGGEPQ